MHLEWERPDQDGYDATLAAVRAAFGEAADAGPAGPFTPKQWLRCGELGLLGLCAPVEHGGGGLGALETAHRVEAFGRGCPDLGLVFAACAHLFACVMPIATFASPDTRAALLPGLCSGRLVAANAMTEDQAGSDTSAMTLTARREGDAYVLSGEKSWASNAPAADVLVTYAATDPAFGYLGLSAFAVDAHSMGIAVRGPFAKMGLDGCPAGSVRFDECRVPASAMLGAEGRGAAVFQHSMGWERACLFAAYVGLMDRLVEESVAHARARRQFGRRIGDFQAVSHRIADMKLRLESARLLLYRACARMDRGEDATVDVALSKLAVSEAAVRTAVDAVQIRGGAGYLRGGVESAVRDAIPATLFSGTSEIQREIIAKGLGL